MFQVSHITKHFVDWYAFHSLWSLKVQIWDELERFTNLLFNNKTNINQNQNKIKQKKTTTTKK